MFTLFIVSLMFAENLNLSSALLRGVEEIG